MTTLEMLLAAWLSLQASAAGAPLELHPPAGPGAVERAEREVGYPLGETLRTVYAIADGQREPDGSTSPASSIPFFGPYRLVSLQTALETRRALRATAGEKPFPADWFPFATDGEGSGFAIDLVADEGESADRLIAYGARNPSSGDRPGSRFASTLTELLRRALNQRDPLHIHHDSDDPRLDSLRRWYEKHARQPSRGVEKVLAEALEPWLDDRAGHPPSSQPEHYEWFLAALIDRHAFCEGARGGQSADSREAARLAIDWLRHTGTITAARHRQLEAIRLDTDGRREALLARTKRERSAQGSVCSYSIDYRGVF